MRTKSKSRLVLLSSLTVLALPSGLFAEKLDVFDSRAPFPVDIWFDAERVPDLEKLPAEGIEDALVQFVHAGEKARDAKARNLLSLAVGYLQLRNKDYTAALATLRKGVKGNFVLEDHRLRYQSIAHRERALLEMEKKRPLKAMTDLEKAINFALDIYQAHPESPFMEDIPRFLAQCEKELGDAYFTVFNYKSAWKSYRRALMRDFPGNRDHVVDVSRSLAKTYETAGDLDAAVEIYGYLLKNFKDPVTEDAFRQFMEKRGPELKGRNLEVDSIMALLSETGKKDGEGKPNGQPDKNENKVYGNPSIQDFYNSLLEGNAQIIAEKALTALARYPGAEEARGIVSDLNHFIAKHALTNHWEKDFEPIINLYPSSILSDLGHALWQNQMPDTAALVYKKILEKYPLETEVCHKALFFLGRISEDKRDFPEALNYYRQLLDRYDSGVYALATRFKIPWVEYLDKRHEDARNHFQDLLDFHDSGSYARWKAVHPNSTNSYQAAGLYWLARTEEALGNEDASRALLKKMVEGFPFDFYSIVSRVRFPGGLKGLIRQDARQDAVYRKPGLGDSDNKRLVRAEQLLAAGFLRSARYELKKLQSGVEDPEFLFYLARLLDRAGEYRRSIKLSRELSGKEGPESFPADLMKSLFPKAFMNPAHTVAAKYDLDPFLALALMRQESAFDPEAVSRANAIGLMQLLPSTAAQSARGLGLDAPTTESLKDPGVNIRLGVDYLKSLLDSFDGNLAYALAAYNAGPRKVREWAALRSGLDPLQFIESIPYGETREYVKAVVRNYSIYLALYGDREIADINELLTIIPR